MKTFPNVYDFYNKLSDEERMAMIGHPFRQVGIAKLNDQTIYFPIGVHPDTNYGKTPGLIFVSPIWHQEKKPRWQKEPKPDWFRVGVKSPDDLDCDLDFEGDECRFQPIIIQFLTDAPYGPWTGIEYRDMMDLIQQHVGGAGKRY